MESMVLYIPLGMLEGWANTRLGGLVQVYDFSFAVCVLPGAFRGKVQTLITT